MREQAESRAAAAKRLAEIARADIEGRRKTERDEKVSKRAEFVTRYTAVATSVYPKALAFIDAAIASGAKLCRFDLPADDLEAEIIGGVIAGLLRDEGFTVTVESSRVVAPGSPPTTGLLWVSWDIATDTERTQAPNHHLTRWDTETLSV
jgi:hypothetical protein